MPPGPVVHTREHAPFQRTHVQVTHGVQSANATNKANQRTTETNVALDMSGTSFGGGDSPFVRLGFTSTRPEADPATSAQAPSEEGPLLPAKMGQSYDQKETRRHNRGGQYQNRKSAPAIDHRCLPFVIVDLFRSGLENVVLVSGGVVRKRSRFAQGRDRRLLVVHCIVHRRRLLEIF